jgi:peptidoglycan hydrolase FlgJ
MNSTQNISDAGLYTDFSGLQKLRTKVSAQGQMTESQAAESQQATKEVAKQFESLFLQMMLKSMRDATTTGESQESDQTRFYQEMFDKQIALDLANNENGGGLGIAAMLERDMGGSQVKNSEKLPIVDTAELIRSQINLSSAVIATKDGSGQE